MDKKDKEIKELREQMIYYYGKCLKANVEIDRLNRKIKKANKLLDKFKEKLEL